MVLSLFFFVDGMVDVLSVASVRRGSATAMALATYPRLWGSMARRTVDLDGFRRLESLAFEKTVEAPWCVCLIILYTRVFPTNMHSCIVCLLNTVFPFEKKVSRSGGCTKLWYSPVHTVIHFGMAIFVSCRVVRWNGMGTNSGPITYC